jgi:hypothetical protein
MQRHAVGDAQFLQQLVGHHQQFDVRLRFGRADDFGVELVELAVAALLRAFIAEQRARASPPSAGRAAASRW